MPGFADKLLVFPEAVYYWVKSAGWWAAAVWVSYRTRVALGFPEPKMLKLKPRGAKHAVLVRLAGSSDMAVFKQVFQNEEYGWARDIAAPRVIFDLGANAGYASAYFLSCFPEAKVVAVEPDPGNFEQCRRNLAPYGSRAVLVQGAVWSGRTRLSLWRGEQGDARDWAVQVRESTGGAAQVEAWDVPGLLELAGAGQVDLLKVDIEGSEKALFDKGSSAWLPLVRNIGIELHGPDCREAFERALKDYDYTAGQSGELTLCRELKRRSRASAAGAGGSE